MEKTQRKAIKRLRGMDDILPEEVLLWQQIEIMAWELFTQAGYHEIRTPVLEDTELFERGVGEETDIVNKEMYSFEKGEHRYTMRPEGTAGVVRAFVENGMSRWPKPVKLFYKGSMFRYERPQAGRRRQFHQMGLEIFGLDSPAADAESIYLAMKLFEQLELPNLSLEINNIGDPESREVFRQNFRAFIEPSLSKLCETCNRRYESNPFRMLDCKVPECKAIYDGEAVSGFLAQEWTSEASQNHFLDLTDILDELGIPWKRNYRLVRGLDYYTNTVFEITSTNLGAQNAVCGGGRYDRLVEDLGGPPTPATGWALGMERLVSLVDQKVETPVEYYIINDHPSAAMQVADVIRQLGKIVEVDLSGKAFGKQFAVADKRKAKYAVILGEEEIAENKVTLKDLATGDQSVMPLPGFWEYLEALSLVEEAGLEAEEE